MEKKPPVTPLYVRTIEDHDPVGVYVTDSRKELFWMVDVATDPNLCEYVPMFAGDALINDGCGGPFINETLENSSEELGFMPVVDQTIDYYGGIENG